MAVFGKRIGGGRRRADRTQSVLPALVTTVTGSRSAVLLDVSSTGAKVKGTDLPEAGGFVKFKVEGTEVYATVQWCDGEMCGIAFETALTAFQVDHVRREADQARFTEVSISGRLAMQDWAVGIAR